MWKASGDGVDLQIAGYKMRIKVEMAAAPHLATDRERWGDERERKREKTKESEIKQRERYRGLFVAQ